VATLEARGLAPKIDTGDLPSVRIGGASRWASYAIPTLSSL